ncbi:MAG: hypothetical protein N2517_09095 [Ignavibacteria bacterium]|nr:hypothetical protein [Ignavibacteria bacterium]
MSYLHKISLLAFFLPKLLFAQILFPTADDSIVAGRKVNFVFKNYSNTIHFLDYSIDKKKWENIVSSYTNSSFEWIPPEEDIDSIYLLYRSYTFTLPSKLWELQSAHSGEISSIDFNENAEIFLSSGLDGKVFFWENNSKKKIDSLSFYPQRVYASKFFPNDSSVVISVGNSIYHYTLTSGKEPDLVFSGNEITRALAVNPITKLIAIGSYSGDVVIFDSTFKVVFAKKTAERIYSLCFSNLGTMLAIGNYSGKVSILDVLNKEFIYEFSTNKDSSFENVIWSVSFDSGDTLLACGGIDGKVRIYDLKKNTIAYVLPSHMFHIRGVNFTNYSPVVASISLDSSFIQYFYHSNFPIHQPIKESSSITSLFFLQGGSKFLLGLRNGNLCFYENFEFETTTSKLNLPYFIPIKVSTQSFEGIAGRIHTFPLILSNYLEIPLKRFLIDDSYAVINIPKEHFGLYHPESSKLVLGDTDTIYSNIRTIGLKDTFALLQAYLLHPWSDRKAFFDVREINFRGKSNLLWIIEKDSILIVEKCKPLNDLNRFELIYNLKPNISKFVVGDKLNIDFNSSRKENCRIILINGAGRLVSNLFDGILLCGENFLEFDISAVSSGFYYLVFESESCKFVEGVIIIR